MEFIESEVKLIKDDLLQRGPFVKKVVDTIVDIKAKKSSFVVGINGVWGEGKSSVKNFIEEELSKKSESVIFINYNPWQWKNEDQIIRHFFDELEYSLKSDKQRKYQTLVYNIHFYAELLKHGRAATIELRSFFKALINCGFLGSFFMSAFNAVLGGALFDTFFWLAFGFHLVMMFFEKVADLVIWISNFFKINITGEGKNLRNVRDKITEQLVDFPQKIIIAIDDIDRLDKEEIKTLFKVIKLNANFPNIIYLLFFDKKIVSSSLHEEGVFSGERFLEKIVNIEFNLPRLDNQKFIKKVLIEGLNEIINSLNIESDFDEKRWGDLYVVGFGKKFKTLRDVKRFLHKLKISVKSFIFDDTLEINLMDLIGIETLEYFYPKYVDFIYLNKSLFTSNRSEKSQDEIKKLDIKIKEHFSNYSESDIEHIKKLTEFVFPNVSWLWSNFHNLKDVNSYALKRMNDLNILERYFSNFILDGDFKESVFKEALEYLYDQDKFYGFCKKLDESGNLGDFLERLLSYVDKMNKDEHSATKILESLYSVADLLSDERRGFFEVSPRAHVERLIHWYFKENEFVFDKKDVYKKALLNTEGVAEVIHDLYDEYNQTNVERRGAKFYVFDKEDKNSLAEVFNKKLEKVKNSDRFRNSEDLPRILREWREVDLEKANKWFENYISDDKNLMDFLVKIENVSFRSQGRRAWTERYISQFMFNLFFDNESEILERVQKIKDKDVYKKEPYNRIYNNITNLKSDEQISS